MRGSTVVDGAVEAHAAAPPVVPESASGRRRRTWLSTWLRTIALYALTLWAVVTVVFVLPRMLPGDPLQSLDDPDSGAYVSDPGARARVEAYYGLDRPLPEQYGAYLEGLVRGDLGWSISQNAPVATLIARRLPWTLLLTGGALALSSAIGYLAGVAAAWRRGRSLDRALIVTLSATRAVPEYAIASVLLVCFAVLLPVLPQSGGQTAFAEYPSAYDAFLDVSRHLVLPLAALTLGLAANQFLLVRNTVISTLGEDYMLLARAKGLPRRMLKHRHSGRNALLPFMTALGVQASFAVGQSLFVEAVFSYPGLGSLVGAAVTARDYPLLQGLFLLLALVVLVANLLVDLAYSAVDPRVGT